MRWRDVSLFTGAAVIAAGLMPAESSAQTFTNIEPPPAGEHTHRMILNRVYGFEFVPDGLNFVNAALGLEAIRVSDDDDQIWNFGGMPFHAEAKAVFAQFGQAFGIKPGASGDEFEAAFDVTGRRYDVQGSAKFVQPEGDFRFARLGDQGVAPASSLASENPGGRDHMVTYQIFGLRDLPTFLLFFEDLEEFRIDEDYNDLVVEIRVIPTPAAFGAGVAMIGGLLFRRRRQA
jgi:hypothetical protein